MAKRRILYLIVLLGSVVFYWAYQKWLGWLLLVAVLCLPVLSLVLSLPALFGMRLHMTCPAVVPWGEALYAEVTNRSWFPLQMQDYILAVRKPLTKTKYTLGSGQALPAGHCGRLDCHIEKVLVSDYLGLFNFRFGTDARATVVVRPAPLEMEQLPQLQQNMAIRWKPKPGGGFAENHEVRLYHPGDNLNQIHWKLSAKTGKLVIREPMIPDGQNVVVGLCLFGSEKELDLKFGRLLSVCNHLLETGITFELQAVAARGVERFAVATEEDLTEAVDQLLGMEPAEEEQSFSDTAARVYWIGGDADGE